jgi:mannose-6-phosphate isomerase
MAGIARLSGTVKHYDWGGSSFIPSLLDMHNTGEKPFAEYWLGVHPQADCIVEMPGKPVGHLREIIHTAPAAALGDYVYHRFGNMPYLLKTLDVKDMLSIQVHPSKANAEKDFADENEKGVSLNAADRNYKDDNHKPELMVAMGEFWLLHGFKSPDKMSQTLQGIEELKFLLPVFNQSGYKGLYKNVMEMPQGEVNSVLQSLIDRIIPLYNDGKLNRSQEDFWAARAAISFSNGKNIDRGIFSVYLFNLVQLQKGEAVFQDAGVPHAYLEGQNVEIMASSDNVLRGGLTTKHINVKELLKHVKCEATEVKILRGERSGEEIIYKTSAPDFELSAYDLKEGNKVSITATTAEIFLLIQGNAEIRNNAELIDLKKGHPSAIVFSGTTAELYAKEPSLIFRASVPVDK